MDEQKKLNGRIAMAMLMQCALVWEYCTKNANEGEFRLTDITQGLDSRRASKSKAGYTNVSWTNCRYEDVFNGKMNAVDGCEFNARGWTVVLKFGTFQCGYDLRMVFDIAKRFCQGNGCTGLMNKAVFGYTDGERWAKLPEIKITQKSQKSQKAKKVSPISAPKPEPTLAERLREILLAQLKQAA